MNWNHTTTSTSRYVACLQATHITNPKKYIRILHNNHWNFTSFFVQYIIRYYYHNFFLLCFGCILLCSFSYSCSCIKWVHMTKIENCISYEINRRKKWNSVRIGINLNCGIVCVCRARNRFHGARFWPEYMESIWSFITHDDTRPLSSKNWPNTDQRTTHFIASKVN